MFGYLRDIVGFLCLEVRLGISGGNGVGYRVLRRVVFFFGCRMFFVVFGVFLRGRVFWCFLVLCVKDY